MKDVQFIPNALSYLSRESEEPTNVPDYVSEFIARHRPIIVLVGAMERVHGIDSLIWALSILKPAYPEFGAILIAYKSVNTAYRSEVDDLVDALDLRETVLVPDSLPDVLAVVRMANVFVRPTRSDGDSIAVREALALGVPVVASQVGYRPDGVILFPAGDYRQLAAAISHALSFPGKNTVPQTGSTQETVARYLQVYRIALGNSPSHRIDG
jgi:glycosyltransferase involved in cell wall biosynthesis